jgi:hypothetical protein
MAILGLVRAMIFGTYCNQDFGSSPDPSVNTKDDPMKDEYDFSKADRGTFFRAGARLVLPVHLNPHVLDYPSEHASARRISLRSLVNALLKKYRADRRGQ